MPSCPRVSPGLPPPTGRGRPPGAGPDPPREGPAAARGSTASGSTASSACSSAGSAPIGASPPGSDPPERRVLETGAGAGVGSWPGGLRRV